MSLESVEVGDVLEVFEYIGGSTRVLDDLWPDGVEVTRVTKTQIETTNHRYSSKKKWRKKDGKQVGVSAPVRYVRRKS